MKKRPMRKFLFVSLLFLGTAIYYEGAKAQGNAPAEWRTDSYDAQRDSWQRNETKITKGNVGSIELLWKLKTDSKPMGMQAFRQPLIVTTMMDEAAKTLAILAGASDGIYARDADTGKLIWQKQLAWSSDKPKVAGEGRGFICNNALTSTPVVSPAGSGQRFVYALASDGYLHTLNLNTGEEKDAAVQMIPGIYGKTYGLNLVDNVVYTITGQGCGGIPNGVFAVDLATKTATQSMPAQRGGMWGVAGPAIGTDGTVYAATGDGIYDASTGQLSTSVLAFTPKDLHLKDYYTPTNHEWLTKRDLDMNTTPVVVPYKGRDVLVVSGKEGRYFLLDSKSLGGVEHETPMFRTPLISNTEANFQTEGTWGNFASWASADGTRWVLAPIGGPTAVKFPITNGPAPTGGVIALKLEDKSGKPELTPAWISRGMTTAETPIVANGIVFAIDAGEFTGQANDVDGGLYSAADRIKRSVPATLYALDGQTGKELWSSGTQVTSFLHQSGIAVAGGRVIFGTFDGTIYCFGIR